MSEWQALASDPHFQLQRTDGSERDLKPGNESGILSHLKDVTTLAIEPHTSIELMEMDSTRTTGSSSAPGVVGRIEAQPRRANDIQDAPLTRQGVMRNRRAVTSNNDSRWVLFCVPENHSGKDLCTVEHLCAKSKITDNDLIQKVKKSYEAGQSKWERIRRLQGFSQVRLIKVGIAQELDRVLSVAKSG